MNLNKSFFRHHATQISLQNENSFVPYCTLTFHVDGGANCGSIKDKDLFYFFINSEGLVQTVDGSMVRSQGWGVILVQFGQRTCLLGPVYYFPNSPRNTFSPGILLNYNIFREANISTNKSMSLVGVNNELTTMPINVYNDLDFVNLTIMCMSPPKSVIASSSQQIDPAPPRRSQRLALKRNDDIPSDQQVEKKTHEKDDNQSFVVHPDNVYLQNIQADKMNLKPRFINTTIMTKIIEFAVQLASPISPRELTIQNMNRILGHSLRYPEATYPLQSLKLQTISMNPNNHELMVPIMANFSRSTLRQLTPHQHWILLHLGSMHSSTSTLKPLIQNDLLADIHPSLKNIANFDCTCWICNLRKATKIPRGKIADTTPLAPFQRIHVDFSFFTAVSIRGFTSALDVTCASTSYPFGFPTKNKSPPIEILRWLIGSLRSMGYVVNFIRVDEGGELANSSSFAEFVFKSDCILESTGAGNSTNNGKVERQNRTKADMIRSSLSSLHVLLDDDLPDDMSIESFWCLAYSHANFIKRRLFHRMKQTTPHQLVTNKKPSARELIPIGAYMTVVHPSKNHLPKLSPSRAKRVYFMGYSNHTKIRLYCDKQNPYTIQRSSNSIIEDVPTMLKLEKCFSSQFLSPQETHPKCPSNIQRLAVNEEMIDIIDHPFQSDDIVTVKLPVPPLPVQIGITIRSDLVVGLPYIQSTRFNSVAFRYLKPRLRSNMYILKINGDDQLSAKAVGDYIRFQQKEKKEYMTFELVKRTNVDTSTTLVSHRTIFDQVPSLLPTSPIISSFDSSKPSTFTEFISSARKPPTPKSFFDALKGPFKNNWKAAAWKHFETNKKIVAFSKPFLKSSLIGTHKIFRSLLVLEVKTTDVPSIWQLKIRHAIVGTPQEKYIDFEDSYAPTVDPSTVRVQICFTCHHKYTLGIIDVKNAFQNTIAPSTSRLYCSLPPTYIEWLSKVYKEIFQFDSQYIMQMLNSCQGTKDASSLFYKLLGKALKDYGFVRSTVDHAYFVKPLDNGHHIYASLATDDILVSFPTYQIFDDLKKYLQQYFELTVQTGGVLKFLGV